MSTNLPNKEYPKISLNSKKGDKCIYIEDSFHFYHNGVIYDDEKDYPLGIPVPDKYYYLDTCFSYIKLFEWKRKHWWSLKYSWEKVKHKSKYLYTAFGTKYDYGSRSVDCNLRLQEYLRTLMELYPDAHIENHSNIIKFDKNVYIRKILTEKYISPVKSKEKIKLSKSKICMCGIDVEGFLTKGKKYRYKEHHLNRYRLDGFERFIFVSDDSKRVDIYPASLFRFKDGKI